MGEELLVTKTCPALERYPYSVPERPAPPAKVGTLAYPCVIQDSATVEGR
jgi:hypothetical protein